MSANTASRCINEEKLKLKEYLNDGWLILNIAKCGNVGGKTIKYKDSLIYVPKEVEKEKVIQTISGLLDWWGEGLLILFAVVLLVIQNKSKTLNILSWLKTILKIK